MELGRFKFLEERIKGVPGLSYIVSVGLFLLESGVSEKDFSTFVENNRSLQSWPVHEIIEAIGHRELYLVGVVGLALLACYLLYRVGSILDGVIFDPLYSSNALDGQSWKDWWRNLPYEPEGRLSQPPKLKDRWVKLANVIFRPATWLIRDSAETKLYDLRRRAKETLGESALVDLQVYKSTAKVLHGSEEWERRVKLKLEISKAARTFILPLIAVLVYGILWDRWNWPLVKKVAALPLLDSYGSRIIAFTALAVFALWVYLWFRMLHMHALYRLIVEKGFWYSVKLPNNQPDGRMLCIGTLVAPEAELGDQIVGSHLLETKIEELRDGGRLRVARLGKGPPLILLHGYPDNLQIWCNLARRLSDRFEVIAFDWPGLGESDGWTGGASPFDMAKRLLKLLDEWGIDRTGIVGTDMGAQPALVFAAEHPDRTLFLVVMNCLAYWNKHTSWEIDLLRRFQLNRFILTKLPASVFRRAQRTFLPEGTSLAAALRDDLWRSFRRKEVRAFIVRMCAGYQGTLRRLPEFYRKIERPTLVLWGAGDQHFPTDHADRLSEAIPKSKLVVIPGAEHWMVLDRSDVVAEEIRKFWR